MGINEEIKDLLHWLYKQQTFPNGDSFSPLNEEHGLNDIIYQIALGFTDSIREQINSNDSDFTLNLKKKDCPGMKDEIKRLFNEINIIINVSYISDRSSYGIFGYSKFETIYDEVTKRFKKITIRGKFCIANDNYVPVFIGMLTHELTHAYDDYNRKKHKAKSIWEKSFKDGLGRLGNDNTEYYKSILQAIMYQTATAERNGYIAQIIGEIGHFLPDCSSSKEAWECLNKCKVWTGRIIPIDEYIPDFGKITNKDMQSWCINYYNRVTGKDINSYDIFVKRINFRWNKFKKKLISQLSKQITDYAFKNPHWQGLTIDTTQDLRRY